jgi:hypothetical protein
MVETPFGPVELVATTMPWSEQDFDLFPAEMHALVAPHFGPGHKIWVSVSLAGIERIWCCDETIWEHE